MASTAIIGKPGNGKSFVCASIALKGLERGRHVFANFAIEGAVQFGLEDLYELPPGIVIIDEAASWFHSRRWAAMGDKALERFNQTRKSGWTLYVATQHENNLDTVIRRNLQYGWLLEARWSSVTAVDPRMRRIRSEALSGFGPVSDEFPLGRPVKPLAGEFVHPLFVYGKRWHWDQFRSRKKGERPIQRHRWWWSWKVADAYNTKEVLQIASTKDIEKGTSQNETKGKQNNRQSYVG